MNHQNQSENRIYSTAIPDRDICEYELQRQVQEEERPKEGIAWFIPNSPPLPNHNYNNYRRDHYRGLERQQDIEMMPLDHQQQARQGQRRARIALHPRVNERSLIRVRNRIQPVPVLTTIRFPRWSLFQVWNNLAYMTCSVPSRVAWDDQKGTYILKYFRLQQIICGAQHILLVFELISRKSLFVIAFRDAPSPLKYLKFGELILQIVAGLSYTVTAFFGMDNLLQLHTFVTDSGQAVEFQIEMGTAITLISFSGYVMYLCTYTAMEMAFYTFHDLESWDWGVADIIQTFAYATKKEILYGSLGIFTFISKIFRQAHTSLMITSSCWTILGASWKLTSGVNPCDVQPEGNQEERPPLGLRYKFLEQLSNKISSYIGFIFLLVLGLMAVSLPNSLDEIFNYHDTFSCFEIVPSVLTFISIIAACVSAMQVDRLEDKLTQSDNVRELPNDIHRLIIYLHRLFRKSVGIGYRGLFVMNFVSLFTYCGAVASLVAFTYETKKEL